MRKSLIVAALMAGIGIAGAANAETKFKFKMTTITPEGGVTFKLFAEQIAKKVKVATDGAVEIKPFGAFVLASIFEGHKAVMDGRADIAHHYPVFEINQNPASAFISDIPGGMGPHAKLLWVLGGGGKELWTGYRNSQGYHGVLCGTIGSEVFAHSHKKIQKLADLKGFRYRTAGANTWVMRKLGAAPTLVPGPEVFTLLERKGIDGAEYLDPFGNYSLGFHKIAKYVMLPGIHAPGGMYEFLMKKSTWDDLPKSIQAKIEIVCDSVTLNAYASLNVNNAKSVKAMATNGKNEVVRLDPELINAVRAAGQEWAAIKSKEESAKGNPWMKKLADSYYDFQTTWTANNSFLVNDRK